MDSEIIVQIYSIGMFFFGGEGQEIEAYFLNWNWVYILKKKILSFIQKLNILFKEHWIMIIFIWKNLNLYFDFIEFLFDFLNTHAFLANT